MTAPTTPVTASTEYVVLAQGDVGWVEFARVTGRDNEAAIKAGIEKVAEYGGGMYVAVPARSWRPVRVTPKVETTLVFGETV